MHRRTALAGHLFVSLAILIAANCSRSDTGADGAAPPPAGGATQPPASGPAPAPAPPYPVAAAHDVLHDATRPTPPTCEHGGLDHRELAVTYRYPDAPGRFPLLVFAHGWAGEPEGYRPLLDRLAAAGYVVAAPAFPVSKPGPCPGRDLAGQAGDVTALVSWVHDGASPVADKVDRASVGALGHSDGGVTVGAMAFVAGFDDPRIGAYAVLAGGIPDRLGRVGPNRVPVLAVNGEDDGTNSPGQAQDLYDRSVAPRALLVTAGGTHTGTYVDAEPGSVATREAVVAFFDRWVRGDATAAARFEEAASTAGRHATDGW